MMVLPSANQTPHAGHFFLDGGDDVPALLQALPLQQLEAFLPYITPRPLHTLPALYPHRAGQHLVFRGRLSDLGERSQEWLGGEVFSTVCS